MKYVKKSLGQNFLIDLNIIKKIINFTEIHNKNIVEIGPGTGALTDHILSQEPKSLILIEKDNFLYNQLKVKYLTNRKVKIFNKDILKFNIEEKLKKNSIIFGNLPYNISSQILIKMIKFRKWPPNFSKIIFMFQKEMANRIIGKFGTSEYGRLSILSNYRLTILKKFDVSPNCFFPKPKVDSTLLCFSPKNYRSIKIKDINNLEKVTNILFSNKRKMINKSLNKLFKDFSKLVFKNKIDLKLRPSDLYPEQYYEITKFFEKH